MARKIGILLIAAIAMIAFFYTAQAQTGEKKWKKTITLPNGDVILNMNGEWDVYVSYLRPVGGYRSIEDGITKITQTGSSFVGISMNALIAFRKGSEIIKGELTKSGFKQVQIISSRLGNSDAKGQISEDGNRIIIDDGENLRLTFTRK
jgi:hypothetical protein